MLYYNNQCDIEMEAEETYDKKETYKVPLTIFEVIRKNKMTENTDSEADSNVKNLTNKETNKDFLFPLNGLF